MHCLTLLLGLAIGACDVTLLRGLTAQQAQELSGQLERQGVAVSLARDATSDRFYQLDVADSSVARAVEALRPTSASLAAPPHGEPSRPLIPTPDAERRVREDALAMRITAALERLPEVQHASVEVTLPRPSQALNDLLHAPAPSPANVQVTLVVSAGQASIAEHVSTLVPTWVPELAGSAITVNETEAAPLADCVGLSHIGPLTVTSTSLPTLRGWLTASLLLHMLTAVALLTVLRRRRAAARPEARSK